MKNGVTFNGETLTFVESKTDTVGTAYKVFITSTETFKKYTMRNDQEVYIAGRMKYVADENNVLVSWKR